MKYCIKCGNPVDDKASFCTKCGYQLNGGTETKNPVSAMKEKKKLPYIIGACAVVAILIAVILGPAAGTGTGAIEDRIAKLTTDIPAHAEEIVSLYGDYNNLSDSKKSKVANREALLSAYREAEGIISARKSKAEEVDRLIASIDTTNRFAQASTVKSAVIAFNELDEYEVAYLEQEDKLDAAYSEVADLDVTISTVDDLLLLYDIRFSANEKQNAGDITSNFTGYTWDEETGKITPDYNVEAHSDYYTPVYVYVIPRYPNLNSSCEFFINLHQTYTGLGIVDSEEHEFDYQSRMISFDSSMGIGEYLVPVEINQSQGGLLDWFGLSIDLKDLFHDMNDFDVSRVEVSDISGRVTY